MVDIEPDLASAAALARLFATEVRLESLWTSAELQQILQHQLDARLPDSLADALPLDEARLMALCMATVPAITTLRELFAHPAPGVELLELVKRHTKMCRGSAESSLPESLASTLYYAAIAAALVRHQARISRHTDAGIIAGFDWLLTREWVDGSIKMMVVAARKTLQGSK